MLTVEDYLWFVDDALDGMVAIITTLGEELANQSPDLPGANSPYAILTHCLGVMEYWAGQVISGRTVQRDRPAEFVATGRVDGLVDRTRQARVRLAADLEDFDGFATPRGEVDPDDVRLPIGRTQGGVLLHIYDELARHRGQMEITRDILLTVNES